MYIYSKLQIQHLTTLRRHTNTLEGSLVIRGETGRIHDLWERGLYKDGVQIAGRWVGEGEGAGLNLIPA